ncbi:MAG: CpaF family protein [Acidimicrobiales bacterium]
MSLSNRIKDAQSRPEPRKAAGGGRRRASLDEIRERAHRSLIDELGPTLYDDQLPADELKRAVLDRLQSALAKEQTPMSAADKAQVIQGVSDDILGYGPIDQYLRDAEISEVMVNGPERVYIERNGRLERTSTTFIDEAHLRRTIDKIVGQVGRRVDESTPMVDARLPDGSRVNAVVHPLAIDGPFLTIRKFAAEPFTIHDLIGFGTLSPHAAEFLEGCVLGRMNILVSGGTGTGKTTLLNVLSSFIPADERIVTIEDAKELRLHQDHVLTMEARPPNIERMGEVTIRDLVRNALRMRPDRIVVGECRGGEALDMLQAMNTGHDGSLTTVHANAPRDSLARLETLVLMAGFDLPVRAIREQMASALDLIVHVSRLRDGTRRVTHIVSVEGKENDVITLQDVFLFDYGMGVVGGRFKGHLKATGIRPRFAERLTDMGVHLDPEIFTPEPFANRPGSRGGAA